MWLKFAYRCVLSLYVMRILWKHYYVHYIVLLSNLREFGIASKYTRYDIVVGDPAYSILSDPFMSFAMVVDIWWNIDYISLALMRVMQCQDFWLYMWGCMYLSRYHLGINSSFEDILLALVVFLLKAESNQAIEAITGRVLIDNS
ncbi:unnamed protein product [Aphanomyces euteiches]